MNTHKKALKALSAMSAIMPGGERATEDSIDLMLEDLSSFSEESILIALRDCRLELKFFPSTAEIISRIVSQDGRPGAEEAWSMLPKDEFTSVVWTNEMSVAFSVASALMKEDQISARMAFKEKYESLVKQARNNKVAVRWWLSTGYDKSTATAALVDAVEKGRLTQEAAQNYLPHIPLRPSKELTQPSLDIKQLINKTMKALE